MEHSLKFLVGCSLVAIFISQIECESSFSDSKEISKTGGGIVVGVFLNIDTPKEYIKMPNSDEITKAICVDLDDSVTADVYRYLPKAQQQDAVSFGRENVADYSEKVKGDINYGLIVSTCFVPETLYGFHELKRVFEMTTEIKSVKYNSNGMLEVDAIEVPNGDGNIDSAMITLKTYTPYHQWDKHYLLRGQIMKYKLNTAAMKLLWIND